MPTRTSAPFQADGRPRCAWALGSPSLCAYHDAEWGVPQRDSRMLWEMLMLEGFQAGLSWDVVLRKREAFRRAFAGFEPRRVAGFGEADVQRLLGDAGIVRSRAKIQATIDGARVWCAMHDRGEDFADWCWRFVDGQPLRGDGVHVPASTPLSARVSAELKRLGFRFVGPTIAYAWMQAVGMVDDHALGCAWRRDNTG
ncbi:MAG: DNA-3-methyladenine glycosylase I [Betaproteobacteria bacterium]|nr:DNA-3-methyladenine glycosylase I [Betaproteobacteria bacterium]MDE1956837.1 DNA-3-methyladenine glycosylase I [Betaproteobacteria bacterium]MDE2150968.1 DNA-3-methyladenine glycosylase I [Betaproteobacteria bacterium]